MLQLALAAFGGLSTLTKILTILGIVATAYGAFAYWRHSIYMDGWNDHKAAIERADARVVSAAKAGRDAYLNCTARGLPWDTRTGQCGGR